MSFKFNNAIHLFHIEKFNFNQSSMLSGSFKKLKITQLLILKTHSSSIQQHLYPFTSTQIPNSPPFIFFSYYLYFNIGKESDIIVHINLNWWAFSKLSFPLSYFWRLVFSPNNLFSPPLHILSTPDALYLWIFFSTLYC